MTPCIRALSTIPLHLLLLIVALSACGLDGQSGPADRLEAEEAIHEAVFRFKFENNASGAQQDVDYYFLSLESLEGELDPSPEFMSRFDGHTPKVEPASESESSTRTGVSHKADGERGLIFRIEELKWINDDKVDVSGGYYEAGLSSSGNTYRAELHGGAWSVTNNTMHWIS